MIGKAQVAPAGSTAAKLRQALELHQQGQLGQAEAIYREILQTQPHHADALHFLGVAALQQGQAAAAAELIGQAIELDLANPASHYNRGIALHEIGQNAEALASFDRALALSPGYVDAWNNRGIALQALERHDEALTSFDRALALSPDRADILRNRGNVLRKLRRTEEALASYRRALALSPDDAEAMNNLGDLLQVCAQHDDALVILSRALELNPAYVDALNNRGIVLQKLRRYGEALASFDQALTLDQDSAEIHYNRGNVLQELKRNKDALISYDRALAIRPDYADALYNQGVLLQSLARYDDALVSYERLLAIRPDYPFLYGDWLHVRMRICDWAGLDAGFRDLAARIDKGKPAVSPFSALGMPLSLEQHRTCAEVYVNEIFATGPSLPADSFSAPRERIRLGYFSADFRDHPVAHLIAGVFETQDRSRFELTAFSFGGPAKGAMRARLEAGFDRFIDVTSQSDADVALLARSLGIDIAIDLMGFTQDSRTGIFAHRAAPIQVSYLGFAGTMGAGYIDYLIADKTIIPSEDFCFYAEKIAHLPHTFQANDARRDFPDRQLTRQDGGLPDRGFVFCNFNQCYKISPGDFDLWMRLLTRVEGSVLWLAGTNATAEKNLRREAAARRVAPDRLIFKQRTALLSDHMAQLQLADLFLDSYWFNAHTTASDALWAGVPLVTRLGRTYASRVAASLLKALGLPELITGSAEAYEELALELATDAPRLGALRQRLAGNRLTSPLFDTALFTRHIETAYMAMWRRHQAGLPPEHLVVQP